MRPENEIKLWPSEIREIKLVVLEAEQLFWQRITKAYPLITSGDLSPDAAVSFSNHCFEIVYDWILTNQNYKGE